MPPEVEGGAGHVGVTPEEQDVEQADQRGSLAAGGHVGAAQVGDDRERRGARRSRPGWPIWSVPATRPSLDPVEDGLAVGHDELGSGCRRTARSAAAANSWPTGVSRRQTVSIVVAAAAAPLGAPPPAGGVGVVSCAERREPQHVAVESRSATAASMPSIDVPDMSPTTITSGVPRALAARRTTPPDSSRRRRASAASTPARRDTMAVFTSPSARFEGGRGLGRGARRRR